ncbi:MAG: CotH kinase family protein [Anaerolineales bacterium]|nr:CotH kinase family protein [Anaerolineales bacterium]
MWQQFINQRWISKVELTLILVFVLGAGIWGISSAAQTPDLPQIPDPNIQAFAYALPNRGWAPLTVYFSAFGSRDQTSQISRYEWDLDGNGSFETDATAAGGYASYVYTKPRDYTISLRVTNTSGGMSIAQTGIKVNYPASSSVDYWTVFDDSQVRNVEIQITKSNWDLMMENPWEKLMVPADAIIFGERVEQIGVSPKGNSTIGFQEKIPLKLDLNAYLPEQEYKNLKMLLFHNNFGDDSLLREKMAYDMMRFAGVNAGHTAYVELWVDIVDDQNPADFLGVYTMVERPDTKFLANRFGRENDQGNLYKADAWFEEGAADLAYYGEYIENYPMPRGELAYALMYKDPLEADYDDIIQLCYAIDGVDYNTPEDFAAALEGKFNVDVYLRYLAVIFLTLNFDQYPDTGNNYYLYHDPGTDKFEWIAWDMGNSWGHFGGGYDHPIFGTENSLGPLQYRPLFTKVFEVENYRQTYQAYLDLLIRHYFNKQTIGNLALGWAGLIRPHLQSGQGDRMFFGSAAVTSLEQFDKSVQEIIELTGSRAEFVSGVLETR